MKQQLLASATPMAVALTALSALSACSSDDGVSFAEPTIIRFAADSNAVPSGGTVNLEWSVEDVERIEISQTGYEPLTSDQAMGTIESNPINESTEFVLTAFNGDKMTMSAARTVELTGIQIVAFGVSPMEIEVGNVATLNWRISGGVPSSVIVTDDQGNEIYSGTDAVGMVEVEPTETTTYTLTAVGATTLTETTTLVVNVNTLPPAIDSFTATPEVVVQDTQQTQLRWTTRNAESVFILRNIDGERTIVLNPSSRVNSTFLTTVPAESANYVLHADNNTGITETATVTVTALVGPRITRLDVSPMSYAQPSTVATITWETMNTDSVSLRFNNTPVPDFPTTSTAGSFQVDVSGGTATFTLRATNVVSFDERSVSVNEGFEDREPNDDLNAAIPLVPNGVPIRGTISDTTDFDWYRFEVTETETVVYAQAGYTEAGGCGLDSVLNLYDATGALIGGTATPGRPQVAPCAEIHPVVNDFARDLSPGTYYISVNGTGDRPTGPYNLFVTAKGPTPLPPNTTITEVQSLLGPPTWSVEDFLLFTQDITGGDISFFDDIMGPFHAIDQVLPPALVLFGHTAIHTFYEREMQVNLIANGIEHQTTFPPGAMDVDNAVFLSMTLVGSSTTTTGSSPDFMSGPIIPNGTFPIIVDTSVRFGAGNFQAPALYTFPSYTAFPPDGQVGPPASPGDGSSHRHLVLPASEFIAGNPVSTGTYTFVVELRDSGNAGYDITVPFEIQ